MDTEHALHTIKLLADGKNPDDQSDLSNDSIFQKPNIIRALLVATQALDRLLQYERRKSTFPGNTGRTWTADEEAELVKAFDENIPFHELAMRLGRTIGGVKARLMKLGKIEDDGSMQRYQMRTRDYMPHRQ